MAYKDKANAIKYNNEFIKQAYDRINLTIPKGMKTEWQAAAKRAGISLNAYILEAVEAKIRADSFGISEHSGYIKGISRSLSQSPEDAKTQTDDKK